ncbi:type IV toxin-antitoxin system AbiEi family antitoxin [Gemmatimonas aurantiaca]|uniref:type IV toxin-antitoxin system AbiEi family antitoxin n=1 Tax=Gemmatimonas aurantiaca TaxID=173480 RepID=UPI00301D6F91
MTRSIPPSLAPLVALLELERPTIVSVPQLTALIGRTVMRTPPRVAIQRLAARGWLLPTGVRGMWEFAPGERAGAFSSGDPLMPVQAALAAASSRVPAQQPSIALGSALWLHDLADRAPDIPEVAMPERAAVPAALARLCRVVHFSAKVAPVRKRGSLLVHTPATILVHLAHRPRDVRSWASILEMLGRLVDAANEAQIHQELAGRPHATRIRLAYLLSGVAPALAERLEPIPRGKVWFGPRRPVRHHDAHLNVADTVLPIPPRTIGASTVAPSSAGAIIPA